MNGQVGGLRECPNSFPEFYKLFINQIMLLDDKIIAQDKLHKLLQYGLV